MEGEGTIRVSESGAAAAGGLLWILLIGVLLGAATTWLAHLLFDVRLTAGVFFLGASLLVVSITAWIFGLLGGRRTEGLEDLE